MRLSRRAFAGGVAGLSLMFFGGALQPASAGDLELLTPGVLTVATEGTYPPFSMKPDNGELDGLEIRVMKEVAKRIGVEYKPVLTKWDSILVGLMSDQYDVISAAMDIT